MIAASSAALQVPIPSYHDEYEHSHVAYGEADKFQDVIIEYEEIEYSIGHKTETEVRSRQIPVPYLHTETETKY
jgi:hypothetical protein